VPSINSALPGVVPSSAKKGEDGLSGGAIFGIVLAILILGGLAAGGAFYWVKVHRKKTRAHLNFERFTGMGEYILEHTDLIMQSYCAIKLPRSEGEIYCEGYLFFLET
jgi:uncharacterized membrane protein